MKAAGSSWQGPEEEWRGTDNPTAVDPEVLR